MSTAEDKSKQYREYREKLGIKDPVMLDEIEEAYFEGYHQAEKDMELTWDDVSVLNCLLNEVEQEFRKGFHEDKSYIGYCKEVLKRFKDFKENNEL